MSLPRETVMDLMALADGELDGDEKLRAESLVSTSEEARRFVEGIRNPEVGVFLKGDLERRATAVGVDAIAQAVVARVRTGSHQPPLPIQMHSRGSRFPRAQGRLRVVAVLSAVAMAAGVALYVRLRPHAGEEAPVATTIDLGPPAVPSMALQSQLEGVEVDEIDSPTHDISLFEITGNAATAAANPARPSSVVIWVEDETGSK
jgi:anti-sigma factor RsiW